MHYEIETEEKYKCLKLIEELEDKITNLENQGYDCSYYKAGIEVIKNTERFLNFKRDCEKTPYEYKLRDNVYWELEDQYKKYLNILEQYKNSLIIDKEKDKELEQFIEVAKKHINYEIDKDLLDEYIEKLYLNLSTIIKKEDIKPLASIIYRTIKVEYNEAFTTKMLRRLNDSIYPIKRTSIFFVMLNEECNQVILEEVYKLLCEDLKKYNINSSTKNFDSYLIEEIVKKDNKAWIPLEERIKISTNNYISSELESPIQKNSDKYKSLRQKLLLLKEKLLRKINNINNNTQIPLREMIKNITNDEDLNTIAVKSTEAVGSVPGIYRTAVKRVSTFGVIDSSVNKYYGEPIEEAQMIPETIFVEYNPNNKGIAIEVVTGRIIPVVVSSLVKAKELPPLFIELNKDGKFDSHWFPCPGELKSYLNLDKENLNKQLDIWEYEGKKAIYHKLITEEEIYYQKVLK